MNKLFIASQLRKFVQTMLQEMELDEYVAMQMADLYEPWQTAQSYDVGKILKYGLNEDNETQLYQVLQSHISQAEWTPDVAMSLYKRIGFTDDGIALWTQPLGQSDAYMIGDRVMYEGKIYICTIDNNVWQPNVYGWEVEA